MVNKKTKPIKSIENENKSSIDDDNFSEEEELLGGITLTAMTLGEGATLYL